MKLFIHIGYPKTGSTSLQRFFSNCPSILYLNNHINKEFLQNLYYARESTMNRNVDLFENELTRIITNNKENKKVAVISSESFLSLSMLIGGIKKRYSKTRYISIEPFTIARKLHIVFSNLNIFDDVNILCVIRNQVNMILSMYAQEYNRFYRCRQITKSFNLFLKFGLNNKEDYYLETLQYYCILKEYDRLFGFDSVYVFLFEELKKDHSVFYTKIADAMGVQREELLNMRLDIQMNKRSRENGYLSDSINLAKKLIYLKRKILPGYKFGITQRLPFKLINKFKLGQKMISFNQHSKNYLKEIEEMYVEGNEKLIIKYKLPLHEYKYPLESYVNIDR